MSYAFRTFVVPAANAHLARALCALESGGEGMFTAGLSSTGQEPATHYVSTGLVPGALGAASPCSVWEQDANGRWVKVSHDPGRPDAVYAASQAANPPVSCTLADVEMLFVASDVTGQDPWTAFGRLGLRPVQTMKPVTHV